MKHWEPAIVEVILLGGEQGVCECCEHVGDVLENDSRRMDCDRKWILCVHCSAEHNEHWDDMWQEYYSGCL